MSNLENRISRIEHILQITEDKVRSREISNSNIESFVDDVLADPSVNISLLPDAIERPLYTNLIKIVLNVLQKTLAGIKLDLVNHELSLEINPK